MDKVVPTAADAVAVDGASIAVGGFGLRWYSVDSDRRAA